MYLPKGKFLSLKGNVDNALQLVHGFYASPQIILQRYVQRHEEYLVSF